MKKIDYCCENLQFDGNNEFCPVVYSTRFREFHIKIDKSTGGIRLQYCYNCGTQLPTPLRKEWFNAMEEALGKELTITIDESEVPEEFRTDRWWKKRGL